MCGTKCPAIRFGNVELMVAKELGQETVTYVGNIYKYYIAYKLAADQTEANKNAAAGVVSR
jgi:hypothetical protein